MINFNIHPTEMELINTIILRIENENLKLDRTNIIMDLIATHLNGCPLDFEKMIKVDSYTLIHDTCGINRFINRDTGKLENCFLPRCAKHSTKSLKGIS